MALYTKGGSSIQVHALRLARLVGKFGPAGAMAYGFSAPAAAAVELLANLIIALDGLGAFNGQGGPGGIPAPWVTEEAQQAFLGMTVQDKKDLLLAQ